MKDTAELLVLGLLATQSMHGYALNEFLEQRLRFVSDLKKPTAYRMLARLYEQALVDREPERVGRRPDRMVYHITPSGKERLDTLLRETMASGEWVTFPHNIALLFSHHLAAGEYVDLLSQRRDQLVEQRAVLADYLAAHTPKTPAWLVLDHDLTLLDVELDWLDSTIEHFRASALAE
jgi:DNA-binding PadR family transcriptional regulator